MKHEWILSHIQDTKTHAVTYYPSDATNKISIVFSDSSNDIGFSGVCNGGTGKYSYYSITGEIKVTDLTTTEIGCKYVEWETYTVQNLFYASRYHIEGGDLAIFSNGTYNLFFTKK
ncbi:MAG TPA: META domain-containing protein [Ignavibacteriaceae bacterium]|nr:META domain-containing protein [Ignavibacteriaceae bacterium]